MSSSNDLNDNNNNNFKKPETSISSASTNSRLSFEDPRSVTLNYEYQEQPTVKLNLTASELQFLEDDNKSQLTQSSNSSIGGLSLTSTTEKPDRNGNRFLASISVLISLGLIGIIINGLYSKTNVCLSLMSIFFSILVYEWNRIHGITLSRKLRPIFNMSSVFATYKHLDPDGALFLAGDKDKYYKWACCNVPELNSELPRTSDEKSPPGSPPNAKSATRVDTPPKKSTTTEVTQKTMSQKSSDTSDPAQPPSEPLEAVKSKNGVEVKLSLPPESFKEL